MTVGQKLLEYMLEKHGNMKNKLIPNTSKIIKPKPSLYNSVVNKLNKFGLNPKNWGVEDLSNLKTRGEAFNIARNKGEKEFMYKGIRYNTNYAGTPEQQLRETGLTNEQIQDRSNLNKNLANNLFPYGYENAISRVWSAGIMNKKEEDRKSYEEGIYDMPELRQQEKRRYDALNLYSGIPQKNNTFGISKYKPTDSKDKNKTYYNFNNRNREQIEEKLINDAYYIDKTKKEDIKVGIKKFDGDDIIGMGTMGVYKVSTGKDKRGKYISYYDKWDLNPLDLSIAGKELPTNFGKPFEIYDRVYVKNYNKDLKRLFYTDEELSKLNPDKKNFDTLALQRELNNRGYKLPKSTKKESENDSRTHYMPNSFDGIFGDETKQALLDWQNKNKKMYGGKLNSNNTTNTKRLLLPSLNKL